MEFLQRINQTKNSNGTGGWAKNSHNTQKGRGRMTPFSRYVKLPKIFSQYRGDLYVLCCFERHENNWVESPFSLSTIMVFGMLCSKFFSNGILTSETQNSENSQIRLKSANANTLTDCSSFNLAPSCFVL